MISIKVWCALIDREKKIDGSAFEVDVSPSDTISALKAKVRDTLKPGLDHVIFNRLVVWRSSEPKLSADDDDDILKERLNAVDLSDTHKAAKLAPRKMMASLLAPTDPANVRLGDDEILLVQLPNAREFGLSFFDSSAS